MTNTQMQNAALDARTVLTDEECEAMVRAFYNRGSGNVPHTNSYPNMRRAFAALCGLAAAPQHKDAAGVDVREPENVRTAIAAFFGTFPTDHRPDYVQTDGLMAHLSACGIRFAEAAAPAVQGDVEPVGWSYEFYDRDRWIHNVTRHNPTDWPHTRNHVALGPIAAPHPASDDARDAGRWRAWRISPVRNIDTPEMADNLADLLVAAMARQAAGGTI